MVVLDGHSLDMEMLGEIAAGETIALDARAEESVGRSRYVVERILQSNETVYGVNTGFGKFSSVIIEPEKLSSLQVNLIRSHAAGVGAPLDKTTCLALMALRANTLAKGFSGVRPQNLEALVAAVNAGFHPLVPEQGSVGASGDLAPLAHLTLNLMGEGDAFLEGERVPAATALEALGLAPITLTAKEGLAFINGTQGMAAVGGLALATAFSLVKQADIIAALTIEALKGSKMPFYERIHLQRPHLGQQRSAKNLWRLLADSEIMDSHADCGKVQDSYSLRCVPQVHGPARDTLDHVKRVFEIEINSATDNPMVFFEENRLISGGNFHGESLAMAFDFAAIAMAEIASIAERRIERLCNPDLSSLPAFLIEQGGFYSGFMMAHVTAAALVSENKSLCHPASVDSISTSAAKEDHVSMGMTAARQFRDVVANTRRVLAIELLCAVQGVDFHHPLKPARALQPVCAQFRARIPKLEKDRVLAVLIEEAEDILASGCLLHAAEDVTGMIV